MARVDFYGAERSPIGEMPLNQVFRPRAQATSPYARVTTPGYQPSLDDVFGGQPQRPRNPYSAPTGGGSGGATTRQPQMPTGPSIPDPIFGPTRQIKSRIDQLLRYYQHSPLAPHDLDRWVGDIASGRTSLQQFENEVRRTMTRPNAATYNYGAPTGGTGGGGGGGGAFNQNALMSYLRTLPATPEALAKAFKERPELFGPGARMEDSDEVFIPGVGLVDFGVNFESGDPGSMRWAFQTGGVPGGGVGSQFSDPYTRQLEAIARSSIERLFRPLSSGPDRTSMIEQARSRAQELQGPGFTPQQRELLQTQVAEPIESLRSASKARALERASSRGYAPSSGLHELDVRDIETGADRLRSEGQRALTLEEINRQEQRKGESLEISKYLSDAETARQLLQEGRYAEALSIAEGLSRLPERRLQLAQGALGSLQGGVGGTDPLSALMSIFGMNQQQGQLDRQNTQSWLLGLGQLATQIPWGQIMNRG